MKLTVQQPLRLAWLGAPCRTFKVPVGPGQLHIASDSEVSLSCLTRSRCTGSRLRLGQASLESSSGLQTQVDGRISTWGLGNHVMMFQPGRWVARPGRRARAGHETDTSRKAESRLTTWTWKLASCSGWTLVGTVISSIPSQAQWRRCQSHTPTDCRRS